MKTREIITLVLGLAAVAGFVATVKLKGSQESGTPPPEVGAAGNAQGEAAQQAREPDAPTRLQNGPAKTARVLSQYESKPDLNIMTDDGMPQCASGLSRDPEFHAYADVAASNEDSQWIPISVDYYDLKTGTIGILSPGNQIKEPERGMFLLTRVPR